ncbi:MAG: recombinase family protein, partial [Sphingomonas sp.]|nr:recombinase family protein [Sphingomonas sp.]
MTEGHQDLPIKQVRCAIYTRKSTDEGLDQAFNSLHAQREACEAYIASQRHEGWSCSPEQYDDGGCSGGSLERPALKHLLADVAANKIDVILIYKIDRLTRALSDFARIVEVLDRAGASFVSVTQAFNTTTSMGRLTLNVLLSFAQFEREVGAERVRDKIAASKKKGMWMGGVCPIGYDVHERALVVNEPEAETVRLIFQLYVKLGSVLVLEAELRRRGIVSKRRVDRGGRETGAKPFSRGALYVLLRNPIYVGRVRHRDQTYPGQHKAIVDHDTYNRTQRSIDANSVTRRVGHIGTEKSGALLVGRLFDERGRRMSPSHTNKGGKRYGYYVSRREGPDDAEHPVIRVPAGELESLVVARLQAFLLDRRAVLDILEEVPRSAETLEKVLCRASEAGKTLDDVSTRARAAMVKELISRVDVAAGEVRIRVDLQTIAAGQREHDPDVGAMARWLTVPARMTRRTREVRLIVPPARDHLGRKDHGLIKLLVRAHEVRKRFDARDTTLSDLAAKCGYHLDYFTVLLKLSY